MNYYERTGVELARSTSSAETGNLAAATKNSTFQCGQLDVEISVELPAAKLRPLRVSEALLISHLLEFVANPGKSHLSSPGCTPEYYGACRGGRLALVPVRICRANFQAL